MANVLPLSVRVRVISALVEGNSLRATARMVGVDKDAVARTGLLVGQGCARLHNRLVRDVPAHVVQVDEQWSFISKKQARVKPKDPAEFGDVYTFVGLDVNTRLAVAFHVGKRDQENTDTFIADLRARLTVLPQLTSDGFAPYVPAVAAAFGGSVDYGQCVKTFRGAPRRSPDHRYEPPREPLISKNVVTGAPRDDLISTSYVERFNNTMRQTVGRKRRLCLAFSKRLENHRAAVALGICAYNLVKVHKTLRTTPAVAAGLAERPWTMEELVVTALAEPEVEPPAPRPLGLREGVAARELPNGRGWLRVVKGGPSCPTALVPPAAYQTPEDVAKAAPISTGQLGLFGAQPRPPEPEPQAPKSWRPMLQLNLFEEV